MSVLPLVHAVYIYSLNSSSDDSEPLTLGDSESNAISKSLKKKKGKNLTLFASEFSSKQELRSIVEFAASDEIYELYLLPISCSEKGVFLIKKENKYNLNEDIVDSLLVLPFLEGALSRFLERSEIYRSNIVKNKNKNSDSIQFENKRISSSKEIFCLKEIFCNLDIDGNGKINFEKWKNGLLAMNISINNDEMQSVFNLITNNNGNEINWKQFYKFFKNDNQNKKNEKNEENEEKKQNEEESILNINILKIKNGINECLNLGSDNLLLSNITNINISRILFRIKNCENLLNLMENIIFEINPNNNNEMIKKWENRYQSHKLRINNFRKILNEILNTKIMSLGLDNISNNDTKKIRNRSDSKIKSKKLKQSNTSSIIINNNNDIGLKKELKTIKKELNLEKEKNKTLQEKLKRAKSSSISKKNINSSSSSFGDNNISIKKIKKLEKEKEKLDKECKAKTKKMDEMFLKISKKDKKYVIISKENAALKAKLGSFQGIMNQKLMKLYDVITEYKKRNKRMKERIKSLLSTIAENDELVNKSKKLNRDLNLLQSELKELEKESSKFKNENETLNDKISQLKNKIINKNNELDVNSNKLEQFAKDLNAEYSKIDELTEQIEVKEVALNDLQIVNIEQENINLNLKNTKHDLNKELIEIKELLSFDINSKYRWFYEEEEKKEEKEEEKDENKDEEKEEKEEKEEENLNPVLVGKLSDNHKNIMFTNGEIKFDILPKNINVNPDEIINIFKYVNCMKINMEKQLLSTIFPPIISSTEIGPNNAKFNIKCDENINDIDIYQIEYNSNNNNNNNWIQKEFKSIPIEITDLSQNTKYSIRCKIKLKELNVFSKLSQIHHFNTNVPIISSTEIGLNNAKFNIKCNENINDIDLYQIEYSSNNNNNWIQKEFESIPIEINNLTKNTKYSIRCKIKLKNNMFSKISSIHEITTKNIENISVSWSTYYYKDKKINLSENNSKATLSSGCDSAVRVEYAISKGMIVEFECIYYNSNKQRDERFGVISSEVTKEADNKCYVRSKPNVYCLTFYKDGRQQYGAKEDKMGYNIGDIPIKSQFKLKLKADYKTYGNECTISFYKNGQFIGPSNQSYSMKLPSGKVWHPVVALDWEHAWCKIVAFKKY